jgi:hypothetical protein
MNFIDEAVFAFEDDTSGFLYRGKVIALHGRQWFVATWLQPNGAGEPIPEWLVPLEAVAQSPRADQPTIALKRAIPRALVEADTPAAERQRLGAVLNPEVAQLRGPGSIQ